ncbi:MAG: hypothetical protein SFV21_05010 [Rhodospirillaceae bacterium]|nr:hypothetical protein [Rhodospirillaceae bacterium]
MHDLRWLAGCGAAGAVLGAVLWGWVEVSLVPARLAHPGPDTAPPIVLVSAWR